MDKTLTLGIMKIGDIISDLEQWAPPFLQESYDNSGLIVGAKDWDTKGVLVALDCLEEVVDEATTLGTAVHLAIENHLNGLDWEQFSDDRLGLMAHQIAKRFIDNCLGDIEEVWGLESGLVVDGLYAGTADCIGIFKGKPTIIDFKTAKKIKRKDWIEDYFLQGAAYANAHNVMYETDIESIAILMVDRDLLFKEFLVNNKEFVSYTDKWKQRIIGYYKKHEILGRE